MNNIKGLVSVSETGIHFHHNIPTINLNRIAFTYSVDGEPFILTRKGDGLSGSTFFLRENSSSFIIRTDFIFEFILRDCIQSYMIGSISFRYCYILMWCSYRPRQNLWYHWLFSIKERFVIKQYFLILRKYFILRAKLYNLCPDEFVLFFIFFRSLQYFF